MGFKDSIAGQVHLGVGADRTQTAESDCRCGSRIFTRSSPAGVEWAHREAFDDGDRTRCHDGGTARPALQTVDA